MNGMCSKHGTLIQYRDVGNGKTVQYCAECDKERAPFVAALFAKEKDAGDRWDLPEGKNFGTQIAELKAEIERLNEVIAEQRRTIEGLNSIIGGETTLDSITIFEKQQAENERLNALIAMKDEALKKCQHFKLNDVMHGIILNALSATPESVQAWLNERDAKVLEQLAAYCESDEVDAWEISGFIRERAEEIRASNQTQEP